MQLAGLISAQKDAKIFLWLNEYLNGQLNLILLSLWENYKLQACNNNMQAILRPTLLHISQ
jgi:hypothetical protein